MNDDASPQSAQRLHILHALQLAQERWSDVLETIAASDDDETAVAALRQRFELDQQQALAVLDTQFRRVSAVNQQRVRAEIADRQDRS